ncbi:tetratricopeptide repeat-containing sensor histidine kinase [Cytophagaceae bacterium YF14B1]|uniref:histidine kinase n=1 Tax=Xanthocytophaga flava TaxID=3048013 RepID=A0AAE3U4E3_9BACT|nr:tetratricopeptide repeat-containing sensor histidine kinase [Xanthocytophaga flavus]MDJ1479146.1 tetratricopeptide repeat-containing sensor histidine kinase [Xanthocytophaga flavus]
MIRFRYLFIFLLSYPVFGQDPKLLDSLMHLYKNTHADSTRYLLLADIAEHYSRSKPDTTILLATQCAQWSEQHNFVRGQAHAYNRIGLGYWTKGNHIQALSNYQKSLPLCIQINDQAELGLCLNNIGLVYFDQRDYKSALKYFDKAFAAFGSVRKKDGLATTLNNMGLTHEMQDNPILALNYYQQALTLSQQIDYKVCIGQSLTNLGYIYINQKKYPEAISYLQKAKVIQEHINDQSTLTSTLLGLSQIYKDKKDYPASLEYAEKAANKAISVHIMYDAMAANQLLYEIYNEQKDYYNALRYYRQYKQFSDSLLTTEKSETISLIQTKLELTQTQKEVEELERDKKFQQTITIFIGLGLAITILFFLLVVNHRRKLMAANKELSNAKTEIEKQASLLQKSNQAKDKIFSIVSHDIRSPLNALRSAIDLIETDLLSPEELKSIVSALNQRLSHASDITEELLHWSRSQMDVIEVNPVDVSIAELFQLKVDRFQQQAVEKQLTLAVTSTHTTLCVKADADMLKTILRNLLNNAIKFSSPGGTIRLHAEPYQTTETVAMVQISIADSGVGIHPENISRIFAQQGYTTTGTSGERGTGLGLGLCKEFVERNGGTIWVSSIPGEGTTFYFTLPAC